MTGGSLLACTARAGEKCQHDGRGDEAGTNERVADKDDPGGERRGEARLDLGDGRAVQATGGVERALAMARRVFVSHVELDLNAQTDNYRC